MHDKHFLITYQIQLQIMLNYRTGAAKFRQKGVKELEIETL